MLLLTKRKPCRTGIHIYSSYLYSYPPTKLELFITTRAVILFGIQIQQDSNHMISISQIQSWPPRLGETREIIISTDIGGGTLFKVV